MASPRMIRYALLALCSFTTLASTTGCGDIDLDPGEFAAHDAGPPPSSMCQEAGGRQLAWTITPSEVTVFPGQHIEFTVAGQGRSGTVRTIQWNSADSWSSHANSIGDTVTNGYDAPREHGTYYARATITTTDLAMTHTWCGVGAIVHVVCDAGTAMHPELGALGGEEGTTETSGGGDGGADAHVEMGPNDPDAAATAESTDATDASDTNDSGLCHAFVYENRETRTTLLCSNDEGDSLVDWRKAGDGDFACGRVVSCYLH